VREWHTSFPKKLVLLCGDSALLEIGFPLTTLDNLTLIFHNQKELIPGERFPAQGSNFPRRFLKRTWAKLLV
jgi:hypothetical protein